MLMIYEDNKLMAHFYQMSGTCQLLTTEQTLSGSGSCMVCPGGGQEEAGKTTPPFPT